MHWRSPAPAPSAILVACLTSFEKGGWWSSPFPRALTSPAPEQEALSGVQHFCHDDGAGLPAAPVLSVASPLDRMAQSAHLCPASAKAFCPAHTCRGPPALIRCWERLKWWWQRRIRRGWRHRRGFRGPPKPSHTASAGHPSITATFDDHFALQITRTWRRCRMTDSKAPSLSGPAERGG